MLADRTLFGVDFGLIPDGFNAGRDAPPKLPGRCSGTSC